MGATEFLRKKKILSEDCNHFLIDFEDDRTIDLAELLEEYKSYKPKQDWDIEKIKRQKKRDNIFPNKL